MKGRDMKTRRDFLKLFAVGSSLSGIFMSNKAISSGFTDFRITDGKNINNRLEDFVKYINSLFDVVYPSKGSMFNKKDHKEFAVGSCDYPETRFLEKEFKLGVLSGLGVDHEFTGKLKKSDGKKRYICWRVLPEYHVNTEEENIKHSIYCRFSTGELPLERME